MKRMLIVGVGLSALLAPVAARADAIGINVLTATYSANLSFALNSSGGTTTTTANGSSAVSELLDVHDSVTITDPTDGSLLFSEEYAAQATGNADWLAVSEFISATDGHWYGKAIADFDLTFSPVMDGTATLGADVTTRSGEYGSGFGSLFDVTTQQQVWQFYFGSAFGQDFGLNWPGASDGGPIVVNDGGIESFPGWFGPFTLPTMLNATDVYDLQLIAISGNPGAGATFSSVQMSGLVPVPEPSSLLLLGTGLVTLGLFRFRPCHVR